MVDGVILKLFLLNWSIEDLMPYRNIYGPKQPQIEKSLDNIILNLCLYL